MMKKILKLQTRQKFEKFKLVRGEIKSLKKTQKLTEKSQVKY